MAMRSSAAESIAASIDAAALAADFSALAQIGRGPEGGYHRIAYSQADQQARRHVAGRMCEAGLDVRVDEAGNTIGTYAGNGSSRGAPIAMGSHTDSVPAGGNYDGVLGVLGGLACIRALHAAGVRLRHSLALINFAAEELTMPGGLIGSRAMAGLLDREILEQPAYDGRSLASHLRDAQLDPARLFDAVQPPGAFAAYLELHVEQGGDLEARRLPIGIVDGIVAVRFFRVRYAGRANHAGTTPMAARHDALVAAAPFLTEVPAAARRHGIVGTVGTVRVMPGAPNVIPGEVELSLDLRSLDEARLDAAQRELTEFARRAGGELIEVNRQPPVTSDPRIIEAVRESCDGALHLPHQRMPSGAGHDAMNVATLCPQGMIFVPSRAGISHAPEEFTELADCVNGARVLLETLVRVDAAFD